MNPRSLIPVGRERDVARLFEPFATLQREIDRLFNDFRSACSARVAKAGRLAFDVLGGGANKGSGLRVGPFPEIAAPALFDMNQSWAIRLNPSVPKKEARTIKKASIAMLALALLGLALVFYDSFEIYNGNPLWCPPPSLSCSDIPNSPYPRVFGVPVGYFGLIYYVYMLCLAALLAFDPFSRVRAGTIIYAALGICFSVFVLYVQLNFINVLCVYCLVSAVTTFLLLVSMIWHLKNSCIDFMARRQPAQVVVE